MYFKYAYINGYLLGRILCDLKVTAREFIKGVNYEMDELVDSQVHI